jgi:hypothetical protein
MSAADISPHHTKEHSYSNREKYLPERQGRGARRLRAITEARILKIGSPTQCFVVWGRSQAGIRHGRGFRLRLRRREGGLGNVHIIQESRMTFEIG